MLRNRRNFSLFVYALCSALWLVCLVVWGEPEGAKEQRLWWSTWMATQVAFIHVVFDALYE